VYEAFMAADDVASCYTVGAHRAPGATKRPNHFQTDRKREALTPHVSFVILTATCSHHNLNPRSEHEVAKGDTCVFVGGLRLYGCSGTVDSSNYRYRSRSIGSNFAGRGNHRHANGNRPDEKRHHQ